MTAGTEPNQRLDKLFKAFDFAVNAVFKECSLDKMQSTLPQLQKDNPKKLEKEYLTLKNNFERIAKTEFNQIVMEADLPRLLMEIDEINKTDGFIATDPKQIIASHRYLLKQQEKEKLEQLLQMDIDDNQKLIGDNAELALELKNEFKKLQNSYASLLI